LRLLRKADDLALQKFIVQIQRSVNQMVLFPEMDKSGRNFGERLWLKKHCFAIDDDVV
jgi:hypothetical protein